MWIGYLAIAISLVSIFLASIALWSDPKPWEKPYRALERDCEEMWEKVESHLGRISRLKRNERSALSPDSVPVVSATPTTQPPVLRRSDLLRRFRAKQTSDGTLR